MVADELHRETLLAQWCETNYAVPELNPDESTDNLTPAALGATGVV